MQKFKKDIYNNENTNKPLKLDELGEDQSDLIFQKIKTLLALGNEELNTPSVFFAADNFLPTTYQYPNEIDKTTILNLLSHRMKLPLESSVFIFWDLESPIDIIAVKELANNWDYIWYDVSDEAILIYSDLEKKLALITEQGYIKTN
jgi:hypothetical protein